MAVKVCTSSKWGLFLQTWCCSICPRVHDACTLKQPMFQPTAITHRALIYMIITAAKANIIFPPIRDFLSRLASVPAVRVSARLLRVPLYAIYTNSFIQILHTQSLPTSTSYVHYHMGCVPNGTLAGTYFVQYAYCAHHLNLLKTAYNITQNLQCSNCMPHYRALNLTLNFPENDSNHNINCNFCTSLVHTSDKRSMLLH